MTAIMNDTPDASPNVPIEPMAPTPPAKKEKKEDSFPVFLIKLVLVVAIFRSFIFAPFNIPSESMLPRLQNGDYLLAAKWPYGFSKYSLPFNLPLIPGRLLARQPERGDVAIFKAPPGNDVDYIKRVIGLPGDTIQMIGGQLHLNGRLITKQRVENLVIPISPNTDCARIQFKTIDEVGNPICSYPQYKETLPGGKAYKVLDFGPSFANNPWKIDPDNTKPIIVPEGHIFAMGDNRDNSMDSRYPAEVGGGVGIVPQENLVGRATIMMWSTDGSANWLLPWTWFSAARWERIGGTF